MTAVAIAKRESLIANLEQGYYLKDLAKAEGVTAGAISRMLTSDPEYVQARETGMQIRLEAHQEAIETASDGVKLACAREAFKAQAWRCEREFPKRWGAKQQVEVSGSLTLDLVLSGMQAIDSIDGECVSDPDNEQVISTGQAQVPDK